MTLMKWETTVESICFNALMRVLLVIYQTRLKCHTSSHFSPSAQAMGNKEMTAEARAKFSSLTHCMSLYGACFNRFWDLRPCCPAQKYMSYIKFAKVDEYRCVDVECVRSVPVSLHESFGQHFGPEYILIFSDVEFWSCFANSPCACCQCFKCTCFPDLSQLKDAWG